MDTCTAREARAACAGDAHKLEGNDDEVGDVVCEGSRGRRHVRAHGKELLLRDEHVEGEKRAQPQQAAYAIQNVVPAERESSVEAWRDGHPRPCTPPEIWW